MKFFNVKTAIAAVCVVAAGMGGFKAYNAANLSETDMLLAENIEALSSGDNGNEITGYCVVHYYCTDIDGTDLKITGYKASCTSATGTYVNSSTEHSHDCSDCNSIN